MNTHKQESLIGDSRKVLLSGTRHCVFYPPNIHDENQNDVNVKEEGQSPHIMTEESVDASLVSADYLSLPNEPRKTDHIAVSGYKMDNDLVLLNTQYESETVTKVYPTASPEINVNQQARYLIEDVTNRPHTPEQDSSPHESLEQGNISSIGTSESTCITQHTYERVRYAKFPEKVHYQDRILTFIDWPHVTPSAAELAKAGMFFQGEFLDGNNRLIKDQVACYKCGGTLLKWKEADDPLKEHRKNYPNCCLTKWMEDL